MKHKHLRNHTIFIVGTLTGLRISDLLRLTWKDVLTENKIEIIEHKTDKFKSIYVTKNLKNAIQKYKNFTIIM